ncbi:50S ribosome-binding GTPase [Aerococcaceae bacterium NML160702]|nr:50S ribosome-binding GTPase [Aerococcaceae bacterium NML191219]MCW6676618.1 50S ribosome-binding GTPase [Aerococcaceae bacterium NML180378]MCW6681331.1 50S ribosome-binding GTPase [Aerococcaceae bacterium NML160702]
MTLWRKLTGRKINPQLAQDLLSKSQQEVEKMPPINIIVAGKTGSGKSTLINALFRENIAQTGIGQPITQELIRLTKEGVPLTLYDTRGLELNQEVQQQVQADLLSLIATQQDKGEREAIHVVYYCINAMGSRIEPFEIELIQTLATKVPVILVVTQVLGPENREFHRYLVDLKLNVAAVVPVLAKPYVVAKRQVISAFGLQTLIDTTLNIVPSQVHRAFINAQQIDINRKVANARRWAKTYVSSAFGVGFVPIPFADATLLIPMQITMLAHLTAIFGVSLDKAQIVSLLAGIGGTSGTTYIGKIMVGSLFKLMPGLGTVSGGLVTGTTASMLTVALGYSYIEALRHIAKAEAMGRDLRLKEIQQLMNQSLETHLQAVSGLLPENVRETFLPEWLRDFLEKQ